MNLCGDSVGSGGVSMGFPSARSVVKSAPYLRRDSKSASRSVSRYVKCLATVSMRDNKEKW
jgi:hypothetical protein